MDKPAKKETKPTKKETKPAKKETKSVKKETKPAKKETKYEIVLDPKFIEELKKYNVKEVFKFNSKVNNKDIINGLIYLNNIFEYKCYNEKCNIKGEWLGKPLELLLIHKNNKETDNRISNLTYNCYNCYFQNNSDKNIFNKVKMLKINSCKICGFNLNKLSINCKKLGICKICIRKNEKTVKNVGLDLFSNTFTNSLTKEDLNSDTNTNILNDSMDLSIFLSDNKKGKSINTANIKKKRNKKSKETNTICNKEDLLSIDLKSIKLETLEEIQMIMNSSC